MRGFLRACSVLTTAPGKRFVSCASAAHVPSSTLRCGSRKLRFFPRRSVKPLQALTSPLPARAAPWLVALLPLIILAGSAPADIALSLACAAFLHESARRNAWGWLRAPWAQAAALLWAYLILRALFAEDVLAALSRAVAWGRFPLFAAACAYLALAETEARRRSLACLAIAVTFLMADCILQYLFGHDLFGRASIATDSGAFRLTGPFSAPKAGLHLVWLGFPVAALLCVRAAENATAWPRKLLALAYAALLLGVVFITGERMAFLLCLLGFALLFLLAPPLRRHIPAFAFLAALTMAGLAALNPAILARQSSTVAMSQNVSGTAYGKIWGSAVAIAAEHPLFGVGANHFRIACPDAAYGATRHEDLAVRCNLHPHHLYLEWLVEEGIVGLVLFLLLLWRMGRPLREAWPTCRRDPVFLGLLVLLAIKLWPLSTANSFFVGWPATPFWLAFGWALALSRATGRESDSPIAGRAQT